MKRIVSIALSIILAAIASVGCGATQSSTPSESAASDTSTAQTASSSASATDESSPDAALADAEFTFVTASPLAEDSVNHFIAYKAKELMETKSGGRITMNIYESGQLGSDRECIESLQAGNIDFFINAAPAFVPFAPKAGIFDLPNVFPNLEVARKAIDSGILNDIMPDYEAAGFKFFGFSDAGFRQTTSNKMLSTMEDFKGLKIRTMQNPYHLAYWSALGAAPTPMDFSELYISLQQGAIDGQENPYDLIVANKLYEPQKYVIETNHILHAIAMMMSKAKYDSLPDDIRTIAEESVREALRYGREVADERVESRKKIITDFGCEIVQISPELSTEMKSVIQPVYDQMRADIGSELVDKMIEASANAEKELA